MTYILHFKKLTENKTKMNNDMNWWCVYRFGTVGRHSALLGRLNLDTHNKSRNEMSAASRSRDHDHDGFLWHHMTMYNLIQNVNE